MPADDAPAFAEAVNAATQQLGRADLVVRCDSVATA
jgi:hypothetical protein